MEQYKTNFNENQIDGYLILELEESDLKEELEISKKLHVKKLLKGIQILKSYTEFLDNSQNHRKLTL